MTGLLISGARLLDPASGLDAKGYLGIKDGLIDYAGAARPRGKYAETLDAGGLWLMPGLVDLCARLREPGESHKATIRSEARAAAGGGITTLCVPPDTRPVIDTPAVVDWIAQRVAAVGTLRVATLGALTAALDGQRLAELGALARAGCAGVSQALAPLNNPLLARRALEYARNYGLTVHVVPLDPTLANHGCAHEGPTATRLGLPGIPVAAETVALAQWLALVEQTGARVHFGRLSSARGAEMLTQARARGLPVTADVAIHHLLLCDEDLDGFDAQCHVIPPLRAAADRAALQAAVKSGAIGAICSDHRPHEADAKVDPFPLTAPGISGLETLLPLALLLVAEGWLLPLEVADRLSRTPAGILGLEAGRLAAGAPADLVLVDPDRRFRPTLEEMFSAGCNTPFAGHELPGRAVRTLFGGRTVFVL